jgi:hypothetical protein
MQKIDPERKEYWNCVIGPIHRKQLGLGADFQLRQSVKEEFEKIFNTVEYKISSGWGITDELKDIFSRISHLNITDPSGKTLKVIKEALDGNTERLKNLE